MATKKTNTLVVSTEIATDLKLVTFGTPMRRGDSRFMRVTCDRVHEHYTAYEHPARKRQYSKPIAYYVHDIPVIGRVLLTKYLRRDGSVWIHMKPVCLQCATPNPKGGAR